MPKKPKKDEELEQQVAELTADLQRVQADFVNFKRRADEDQKRAVLIGREGTIRTLLPTIDNIERALSHVPDDLADHDFMKALQSVAKKLEADLKSMGLEKIATLDQDFDPATMEAISMDEDGEGEREVVIEELQSGYTFGGEIIRHAMVRVGRR